VKDTRWVIPTDLKNILSFSYSPPVGLHGHNFTVKHTFNKLLELMKILENFRLAPKQINPRKFTEIINETNIIVLATK
jgi:hypothetical protein